MEGGMAGLTPIVVSRAPGTSGPDLFTWEKGFADEEIFAEEASEQRDPAGKKMLFIWHRISRKPINYANCVRNASLLSPCRCPSGSRLPSCW